MIRAGYVERTVVTRNAYNSLQKPEKWKELGNLGVQGRCVNGRNALD